MNKTIISNAGIIKRKSLWGRLTCLHYWHDTHIPDDFVFMNGKFQYLCLRCGKDKYFRNDPVNPTLESGGDL